MEIYHHTVCPFSRAIRIILEEKQIDYTLHEEKYWERRREFVKINPASSVPIILDNGVYICGIYPILEYFEEQYHFNLMGHGTKQKADIRRLLDWFGYKLHKEVSSYIVDEKVIKYLTRSGEPNSLAIRAAKNNLSYHMEYIGFMLKQNKWIAGESLTYVDFITAAQLSILDYVGDIAWEHYPMVKDWYSVIKSRPSFKPILQDSISNLRPSLCYKNLDF